jgi:ribulose-phosphate 3-epimerase
MPVIAVSLLSCDFLNIGPEMDVFNGIKNIWYHLDIMDGHFVPNLSFGHPLIKKISEKAKHPLDAHIMVSNPEFFVDTLGDFNIHNLTFHIEASSSPVALIRKMKKKYPSVGVSLRPGTPLSQISDEVFSMIDLVLVMSVEPGFGGQGFLNNSLNRIDELARKRQSLGARFAIEVDGGISDKNAKDLVSRGADILVSGSWLFSGGAGEYKRRIDLIR